MKFLFKSDVEAPVCAFFKKLLLSICTFLSKDIKVSSLLIIVCTGKTSTKNPMVFLKILVVLLCVGDPINKLSLPVILCEKANRVVKKILYKVKSKDQPLIPFLFANACIFSVLSVPKLKCNRLDSVFK